MPNTLIFADRETFLRMDARLVEMREALETKEDLIGWYAGALPLPDYWSCNWDAFSDFLEDLSWISDRTIDVYHDSLPLTGNPGDLAIYINILHATVRHWRRFPEHDVRVAFHPCLEAAVSRIPLDEV